VGWGVFFGSAWSGSFGLVGGSGGVGGGGAFSLGGWGGFVCAGWGVLALWVLLGCVGAVFLFGRGGERGGAVWGAWARGVGGWPACWGVLFWVFLEAGGGGLVFGGLNQKNNPPTTKTKKKKKQKNQPQSN